MANTCYYICNLDKIIFAHLHSVVQAHLIGADRPENLDIQEAAKVNEHLRQCAHALLSLLWAVPYGRSQALVFFAEEMHLPAAGL